jgi:hypothetical protein
MKEFDFICYKYVHCNMVIASPPLEIGRQQCTLTIQFLWEKLNYTLSILKIADAQIFPSSTRPIISISAGAGAAPPPPPPQGRGGV